MISSFSARGGDVRAACATHVGRIRIENEDALAANDDRLLWAVADGMGGHARGAWAAAQTCAAVGNIGLSGELAHDREALADQLARTNAAVHAESMRHNTTIGTTVVALLLADGRFACLWAGDSRAYLLRGGCLRQVTSDHSQVQELVAAGLLTPERARDHPLGNVVTRAIGVAATVAVDRVEDTVLPGDRFLLCSDGLTKVVSDAEIASMLAWPKVDEACRQLLDRTLQRGAPDNVSLIVVDVRSVD